MHPMLPIILATLGVGAERELDAQAEGCLRNRGTFTVGIAGTPSGKWIGPPPHSHRVKAKRRALRVAGGRR